MAACPEEYDCGTCEVPDRWGVLGPLNSHAWSLYTAAATRLAGDTSAFGAVVLAMIGPIPPEDFADCWQRLSLIHEIVSPRPDAKHGSRDRL